MKTVLLISFILSTQVYAGVTCTFSSDSKKSETQIVCGQNRLSVYTLGQSKIEKVYVNIVNNDNGSEKMVSFPVVGLTVQNLKQKNTQSPEIQKELSKMKIQTTGKEVQLVSFELKAGEKYFADSKMKQVVPTSQFVIQRNVASGPPKVGGVRGE